MPRPTLAAPAPPAPPGAARRSPAPPTRSPCALPRAPPPYPRRAHAVLRLRPWLRNQELKTGQACALHSTIFTGGHPPARGLGAPRTIGQAPACPQVPARRGRRGSQVQGGAQRPRAATPKAPLTWEGRPRTLRGAPEPDPQKQQKCYSSNRVACAPPHTRPRRSPNLLRFPSARSGRRLVSGGQPPTVAVCAYRWQLRPAARRNAQSRPEWFSPYRSTFAGGPQRAYGPRHRRLGSLLNFD